MTAVDFDPIVFEKAERTAERHGTTLVDLLRGLVNGYAAEADMYEEDSADLAALRDAMAHDDGTRYTADQVDRMLDGVEG